MNGTLSDRFLSLVERHVHKLCLHGHRATGLCIFHPEKTPSLSIDLEKCVFYCFGCGVGGGVKKFAELVGEPWTHTRNEPRAARARRARFQAERQARAILQRRAEEHNKKLCDDHREVYGKALAAAGLLTLFWRRSDLAEEFSDVLQQAEKAYGEALFQLSIVEAQLTES